MSCHADWSNPILPGCIDIGFELSEQLDSVVVAVVSCYTDWSKHACGGVAVDTPQLLSSEAVTARGINFIPGVLLPPHTPSEAS